MKTEHKQFAGSAAVSLALLSPLPHAVCAGQVKQAAAIAATIAVSAMVSAAFLAAGHRRQQHRPVPGQQKIDVLREQYRTNPEPQGT
ncbi:hypothetical protein [Methylobacterium radiotolerans]|uniref:Uncharacterized protein n=1 Tax=Methylobacterium radiotolerans (strain ATCC 27329 / DSM 1819 / JCM 2831 / NBRC 15690 / NCIMB 10815 / 0-1) TaxID=426355 RepID=B1M9Q6_METRJ|nr:hypothetical protein [Methylobacterium radiotolerans]ACB28231.1 hypothetical protein Mrad2831_6309 [Methylobacterium radiotolerans JCM 2831]GEN01765.1 hypothetical protein MRA01_63040 [Methylobacterium radiotolerans]